MTTLLHGIDRAAPAMVDNGSGAEHRSTWGEFVNDNADGIEAGDVAPEQLARDLLKRPGRTAFGCDMAGRWSIRLLVGEEATR